MSEDYETAETLSKGHGRLEHRHLTSSALLNEHLDWPGVNQICRVVRTRSVAGKTSAEVSYAITSISRDSSKADDLLHWWRSHWGIENRVHWIRDEVFGEDRCRVRTGAAPQILAGIRNLAINWLRSNKVPSICTELRQNSWNSQRLFVKLGKQNL